MKSAPANMLTCVISKPDFERKIFSNTIKRFFFFSYDWKKMRDKERNYS